MFPDYLENVVSKSRGHFIYLKKSLKMGFEWKECFSSLTQLVRVPDLIALAFCLLIFSSVIFPLVFSQMKWRFKNLILSLASLMNNLACWFRTAPKSP